MYLQNVSIYANISLMREIKFLVLNNKKCPVEEFLDSLNSKMAQKVTWVLSLIEEEAFIPQKYFKKLTNSDDIWECRISFSSDIVRIFAFFDKNNKVILTHGFIKKTQKTPREEILRAENYKKEYLKKA